MKAIPSIGKNQIKSVVVTGASGFIGCELLKELTSKKIKVYAVVRNESRKNNSIQNLSGIELIYSEMDELISITEMIEETPDAFCHLAWAGSTGNARADYELQLKNVKWTVDAVHVAHKLGCKHFLAAGTLAELDVNAYSAQNGSTPNAVSNYGVAKIAAHYMSKAECNKLGISHLWAYLSNTYGMGDYTSNFINFAVKSFITKRSGDFTAGEQLYDFVNVIDAANGLACILQNGRNNYAYYIGSTEPRKLKEYIYIIRDAIDETMEINLGVIPFNGISHLREIYDCSDLVNHTGYRPQISFEEGIKTTVEWIRTQMELGRF